MSKDTLQNILKYTLFFISWITIIFIERNGNHPLISPVTKSDIEIIPIIITL